MFAVWTTKGAHVRPPLHLLNRQRHPFVRQHDALQHRDMTSDFRHNTTKRPFILQIQDMLTSLAARLSRSRPLIVRRKWSYPQASSLVQVVLADFGRRVLTGRGRDTLLSAACLSVYNWEEYSVPEKDILSFVGDLDFVVRLTEETLTCRDCKLRLRVDQKVPSITYCSCPKGAAPSSELDGWMPFIERPNTLVWRKEHENYKGMYAYKSEIIEALVILFSLKYYGDS